LLEGFDEESEEEVYHHDLFTRWHGLVDEHDGDVVLDDIHQVAAVTDKAVPRTVEPDIPLALGAA
jgi:hypothetical protein